MGAIDEVHKNLPEPYAASRSPSLPPIMPALTKSGRPQRAYRPVARYNDIQPAGPAPLPPTTNLPPVSPGSYALPRVILHVRDWMRTRCNEFGLLREYAHRPSYDPDSFISDDNLSNYTRCHPTGSDPQAPISVRFPPWPFQNMSIYLLMEWMITGGNQKSVREIDRLAKDVLGSESFKLEDLAGFNVRQANKFLDHSDGDDLGSPYSCDGWLESAVQISVPTGSKDSSGR